MGSPVALVLVVTLYPGVHPVGAAAPAVPAGDTEEVCALGQCIAGELLHVAVLADLDEAFAPAIGRVPEPLHDAEHAEDRAHPRLAVERDAAAIEGWRKRTWPALKKTPDARDD